MWQRSHRGIRVLMLGIFLVGLSGCDIAAQMEQMLQVGQDISKDLKNELGVDAMVVAQNYGRMGSMVSVQILKPSQVENVSLSQLKRSMEPIIIRHQGSRPTQLMINIQYMQFENMNTGQSAASVSDVTQTN